MTGNRDEIHGRIAEAIAIALLRMKDADGKAAPCRPSHITIAAMADAALSVFDPSATEQRTQAEQQGSDEAADFLASVLAKRPGNEPVNP